MKRIFLTILFAVFVLPAIHGQAALIVLILGDKVATESFHLSIDGALNISNFKGLDPHKTAVGVDFGLGVHIKLGDKWHLKPEFKPLSKRVANNVHSLIDPPSELTVENIKLKLNYIDVPVFLQYNPTPRLFVSAGPQISFLTDADQVVSGTYLDGSGSTLRNNTESFFNKINYSFPVEIGYTIRLATKRSTTTANLHIFGRYEYDFGEIFKDPASGSANISLFQIGLSMPFVKSEEELAKNKK